LVNLPNWLLLELRIEGEALRKNNFEILSYRHENDVRYALLKRNLRFRDRAVARRRYKPAASSAWRICTKRLWSGRSYRRTGRARWRWSRRWTAGS
jgi:Glycosyl hydrolase family 65, N-terminal domain